MLKKTIFITLAGICPTLLFGNLSDVDANKEATFAAHQKVSKNCGCGKKKKKSKLLYC